MVTPPTGRIATLLLLLLATAPLAEAQEAATSLEQLRRLVKDGDSVTVTDTSGREITRRIADLSASSLTLLAATRRHDFADDGISMIRRGGTTPSSTVLRWAQWRVQPLGSSRWRLSRASLVEAQFAVET